jgi:hypothetical protein
MNLTGRPIPPKPEKAKRDPDRLARVKQLPCVICGAPPPSDAHHCIGGRYSQRKAPDSMTIPLCKADHQDGPYAIHNDKAGWEARNGKDTDYLAEVDAMLAKWF